MIETLQSYLTSKNIIPVYAGFVPATSGITLTPYASRQSDVNQSYDYMSLQIRTKFNTYPHAELIANQCYLALQGFGLVFDIINCYAKQAPFFLKQDEQGFIHFSQNFEIEYYNRNRT